MKKSIRIYFLLLMSIILLQACGGDSQSAIQTAVVQTQEFSQLETAIADFAEVDDQDATPVPEQEAPPTPTATEESAEQQQARVHLQQGKNLYYQGEGSYEGAAAQFTLAVELSPDFAEAYYFRSQAKYYLSFESSDVHYSGQVNLNALQIALSLMEESLSDYTIAIELDPQFALDYYEEGLVYYELGILNEDLGNDQPAVENYTLFLGVYPIEDALTDYASDVVESLSP